MQTAASEWVSGDLVTHIAAVIDCTAANASAIGLCCCTGGGSSSSVGSSNGSLPPNTTATAAAWGMKYSLSATIVIGVLAAIASIVTVVGNIMVLVAFVMEKSLRQPSNYLIASLAVTDVLIGMFSMPLYTLYLLSDSYWPLGQWACDLWLSLDYTVCLVSQYTVFLITLDRFCSVKIPAKYRNWRTGAKIKIMIAATWLVPSLVFFISVIGWQYFVGIRTVEVHQCFVQFTDDPLFNTILVISYYWVTLIIMVGLYVGIYRVALGLQVKSEEKRKRISKMTAMSTTTTTTTNPPSPQPRPASVPDVVAVGNGDEHQQQQQQLLQAARSRVAKGNHSEGFRPNAANTLGVPTKSAATAAADSGQPPPQRPHLPRSRRTSAVSRSSEADDVSWSDAVGSEEAVGGVLLVTAHPMNGIHVGELGQPQEHADVESRTDKMDSYDSPLWRPRDSLPRNKVEWDYFSDSKHTQALEAEAGQNGLAYHRIDVAISEPSTDAKSSTPFLDKFARVFAQIAQMTRRSSKKSEEQRSKSENRARKALRTITLILGAFVFFWTPYHITVLVYGSCSTCVNQTFYAFSYWLCYCNSPINPFCYALANDQFKKSFLKMLRFEYCRLRGKR